MTDKAQATVTCAACGARQTLRGSQWAVTVAAEVWEKTHSRAAHFGQTVPVKVARPETRPGSAAPARRM